MSLRDLVEQEPVQARIKLTWDMAVGIIGSIVELYDRIQQPGVYDLSTLTKDLVATAIIAFMFCSHYPRNGRLIVIYIPFIFFVFWQIVQAHGIVVEHSFLVDVHLFSILFYVAKVVLDLAVVATGSRLV